MDAPREEGTEDRARATAPVVLVTGSVRGLGLGTARALRDEGAAVHVQWRSEGPAADALRGEWTHRAHRADLEDEAQAVRLVESVLAVDGRLDGLVHAVGPYVSGPLAELDTASLRRMWTGNVESAFHVFGAARAALRAARGSAVFFGTSGLEGMRARRSTAAYAAAKSALRVLVRSWAQEEAPHGVRVNLVSPGHVPHAAAHPDTLDEELLARIPLGRPGTPADVAAAVRWLLSPDASYTTGVDLGVTGGWLG